MVDIYYSQLVQCCMKEWSVGENNWIDHPSAHASRSVVEYPAKIKLRSLVQFSMGVTEKFINSQFVVEPLSQNLHHKLLYGCCTDVAAGDRIYNLLPASCNLTLFRLLHECLVTVQINIIIFLNDIDVLKTLPLVCQKPHALTCRYLGYLKHIWLK